MKTYYIYHIPGVKIGCSTRLKDRVEEQGYTEYEILEEHTDIDVAADREIELQKQYGYKVDLVKYNEVDYVANGKRLAEKWASINGKRNAETGHMSRIQKLGASIGGKIGGRKAVESGRMKEMSERGNLANREKYGIRIEAINLHTNEVMKFDSIHQASNYTGVQTSLIRNCLRGMQPASKGYNFKLI